MQLFTSLDKFPDDAERGEVIAVEIPTIGRVSIEVLNASRFNVNGFIPGTKTKIELWPNAGQGTKGTICTASTQ